MKKVCFTAMLIAAVMCACWLTAANAETVSFMGLKVDKDTEYVDLGKIEISYDDNKKFYAFLDSLPNVKKVDMFGTRLTYDRMDKLAARYPDIEFGWTMKIAGRTVRTDATAFSMRNNGDASYRGTSQEFSYLKYCKNLRALDLGHNDITDLSFLYDLPQLRVLILVDNSFKDITPIASLQHLQYLELFYNGIKDISPLASLTELVDLNICYNYIQDITPLYGLTSLRRLWIGNYMSHNGMRKVDETVAAELMENLPDTYIDYWSLSVEGGWRDEDSHYGVIRRIFALGGSFEPFEDVTQ